jgi:hypothetical protein
MTVWLEAKDIGGTPITLNCDHVFYLEPYKDGNETRVYVGDNIVRYLDMPYQDVVANIRKVETRKTR